MIEVEVWDDDSKEWKRLVGKEVKLYLWWTRGNLRDKWIQVAMTDGLGEGDKRSKLVSVYPELDSGPVFIKRKHIKEVKLKDIALGEADGHRFRNGSVVISPSSGTRFVFDADILSVVAVNQDGDIVTDTEYFSASGMRVDRDGNFVFEIERDQNDELHVAFIIRGLRLRSFPDVARKRADRKRSTVTASLSGAIFGGRCLSETWTLVKVLDK